MFTSSWIINELLEVMAHLVVLSLEILNIIESNYYKKYTEIRKGAIWPKKLSHWRN